MKTKLLWNVTVGLAVVCLTKAYAVEPLCLVRDGRAQAAIVQAAAEGAAVGNLRKYVKEITGADIPVVPEDKAATGPVIHVGQTAYVKSLNLPLTKLDKEGVVLKRVGDKLVLAGGSAVGTQHAVALFLEEVCGVRWYIPGPEDLWRIVPQRETIAVGDLDRVQEPSFKNRSLSGIGEPHEWMALNRAYGFGNRLHIPHNIANILPPDLYDKHPEYFPLIGGERVKPLSKRTVDWHPCLSNPGVAELAIAAARKHFTENPESEIFSVAQNDNWGWCQCANCFKMNGGEKYDEDGTQDFSNLFIHFANRVAEEVEKTHPGKLIGTMAYQCGGTFFPPTIPVHSNVVVLVVGDRSRFHFDAKFRGDVEKHLKGWAKHARYFTFHNWHFSGIIPIMELKSTAEFLRFGHAQGAIGYHGEEYPNWCSTGPKTWITARLLWNVNEDVDRLLQDFCDNSFGKASAPMRRFYDTLEEMWNTQPISDADFKVNFGGRISIFSPETAKKCRACLEEAKKLAGDEKVSRRIAQIDKTFRITEYLVQREAIYRGLKLENHLTAERFPELVAALDQMQKITDAATAYRDTNINGDEYAFRGGRIELPAMDIYYSQLGSGLAVELARREVAEKKPSSQAALSKGLLERFKALSALVKEKSGAWAAFSKRVDDYLGATTVVPRLAQTPVLDGTMPEIKWPGAAAVTGFRVFQGNATLNDPAKFQTTVYLGYDDQALYIAYVCNAENFKTLVATCKKRDSAVWRDDCADFTILPANQPKDKFFHYIVNADGALFDALGESSQWNGKSAIARGRDEKAGAWIMEVAIPWSDFGRKPVPGEVWRAQFGRAAVVQSTKQTYSCWAPTSGGFNNADYLGVLMFE